MAALVDPHWLESRLTAEAIRVVDPRRPIPYLQGHLAGAVNVPALKAFDAEGRLLPDEALAEWLGRSGIGAERPVVLYDGSDGQSGALLAWLLEYLGHPDVRFLEIPLERWKAGGRELFYRPVAAEPARFDLRPRSELRASWRDLAGSTGLNVLDVRSAEEYSGKLVTDGRPGHIPGATNVPWLSFVGEGERLLRPAAKLRRLLAEAGIRPERKTVAYCRTGPRAAVAFLALQQLGYAVSLYDGSFADWARRPELEVEV